MFRRFTIRSPSALLPNATSPANFNKSSSLFPVLLQSHAASDCCFPVLVTKTHNVSSSNSFNSSCFIAPTPVLLKPSLTRNSSNNKKKETTSSSKKKMDFGKELSEIKLKFEALETSQREILHLLQQLDKRTSPANTSSSSSSENEVSPTNTTSSSSVEWMKEIRSDRREFDEYLQPDTDKFDEYLKPETTEIPSQVVINFCEYLKHFVEKKHPNSKFHTTVVRDGLLWVSKFIDDGDSAIEWSYCVCKIVQPIDADSIKTNREIFGTEQVRDVFVVISEFATCDRDALMNYDVDKRSRDKRCRNVVDWCCSAIWKITDDDEFNQTLFATTEILKCFVLFSKVLSNSSSGFSSLSISCGYWLLALRNITKVKENQQVFGTVELRDSMIRVAKFIDWARSRDDWLKILQDVTNNNETAKKLFFVDALKDEKERIESIRDE